MEKKFKNVRFILAGNREEGFTATQNGDAILSRCTTFRLPPLPEKQVIKYAQMVCEKEQISISPALLAQLCVYYEGDLRAILNDGIERLLFLERPAVESDIDYASGRAEREVATKCLELSLPDALDYFTVARTEQYLSPRRFIKELFLANKMKMPEVFAKADARVRSASVDLLIQVAAILSKIKGG
jgi:DNA polymerase III delta prime subunit